MALLFCSPDDDPVAWGRELTRRIPGLDFRVHPEIGERADITSALVWLPPPGLLASLPNLKGIFSLGAGVERLLQDPTLPALPLCRMVDPSMTSSMSEFVLTLVLRYHRSLDVYEAQQRACRWRLVMPQPAEARTVGILGLGVLGSDAARLLVHHDFTVKGWSRSAKHLEGVETFHGHDELGPFLADLDILVCLLPLTAETAGMLDQKLLRAMKPGARLINAARGRHVVDQDLIDALDTGQLAHATLDVFVEEPLPAEHPFWRHPKVTVIPHSASYSLPESGADIVAENYDRLAAGKPLLHLVDRARGY